jgi:hypothetical protein
VLSGGQRVTRRLSSDRRGRSLWAANAVFRLGATGRAAGGVRWTGGAEWCDDVLCLLCGFGVAEKCSVLLVDGWWMGALDVSAWGWAVAFSLAGATDLTSTSKRDGLDLALQ